MTEVMTWIVLVAAAFTALGFIFKKIIIPGYKGVGAIEDALPVFKEFTTTFRGNTDVFTVIRDIASQFRTDSGSSLRDAVDGLGRMAETNRVNIESARNLAEQVATEAQATGARLEARFEASRQMDEQKAQQAERLMLQNDRTLELVKQMMVDRVQVAADLLTREKKVDDATDAMAKELEARQVRLDESVTTVAKDLADAHGRADSISGDPGEAADAASQTSRTDEIALDEDDT